MDLVVAGAAGCKQVVLGVERPALRFRNEVMDSQVLVNAAHEALAQPEDGILPPRWFLGRAGSNMLVKRLARRQRDLAVRAMPVRLEQQVT